MQFFIDSRKKFAFTGFFHRVARKPRALRDGSRRPC
jgi:hypothetical protein